MKGKKVYFLSDVHLGLDARHTAFERESLLIKWLQEISKDCHTLYLVGDIFDYWFEYKHVIPNRFIRFLAALSAIRDRGIPVYLFSGNHDMWMFSWFTEEMGIPVMKAPVVHHISGKSFYIGHGDGLGSGDTGYKIIKSIFSNPICQWIFRWLHPDIGIPIMKHFSKMSRHSSNDQATFEVSRERLVNFCEKKLQEETFDYFIFGHRHLPIDHLLSNQRSRYINLGDWLHHYSYAVFDGETISIEYFEP